jgi:hypothetical protein
MATLPDITVTKSTWTNAYTATGITVGASLIIQSKGGYLLCQLVTDAPDDESTSGVVITPLTLHSVTSGETGCFIRSVNNSTCPVNIQQGD